MQDHDPATAEAVATALQELRKDIYRAAHESPEAVHDLLTITALDYLMLKNKEIKP